MKKIDLIIDALEKYIAFTPSFYDLGKEALDAARELRALEPVAWWERDADTNNWFLTTSFNECEETEPLYALEDTK